MEERTRVCDSKTICRTPKNISLGRRLFFPGELRIYLVFFIQRELTKVPHMATTPGDEATVDFMLKRWQDPNTGLDSAWRENYKVYLSFPNKTSPNKVSVGKTGYLVTWFQNV